MRVALDRACVCCCAKPSRGDAGRFRFAALNARRARQASAMTRGAQRQMKVSCSSRSAAAVGRTNDEHTLSRGTTCTPHRHQNHQRSTPTRVPRARSAERRRRCPLIAKMPEARMPIASHLPPITCLCWTRNRTSRENKTNNDSQQCVVSICRARRESHAFAQSASGVVAGGARMTKAPSHTQA